MFKEVPQLKTQIISQQLEVKLLSFDKYIPKLLIETIIYWLEN